MKKLILITAFLIYSFSIFSQTSITAGMTWAQLRAALNANFTHDYPRVDSLSKKGWYNVLKYGAVADGITDNTAVIQGLIAKTYLVGGTIYFPAGTYKTHTLTVYYYTNMTGDGFFSKLKSISAEPLLNIRRFGDFMTPGQITNLTLEGDDVGTIGINMRANGYFHHSDLYIQNFTQAGINIVGSLTGQFTNCVLFNDYINVKADTALDGNGAMRAPANLITFSNCVMYFGAKYGIQWNAGSMLRLEGCNFEWNATYTDSTTAVVYYRNAQGVTGASFYEINTGLIIDNCWFEGNGICLMIDDANAKQSNKCIITNSTFTGQSSTPSAPTIKMIGINSQNFLVLKDNNIEDFYPIRMWGANAHVINYSTLLKTAPVVFSGTYIKPIDDLGFLNLSQSGAPANPTEGVEYYNTTDHHKYVYNGSTWKQLDN